jgi:hypothetical protein
MAANDLVGDDLNCSPCKNMNISVQKIEKLTIEKKQQTDEKR